VIRTVLLAVALSATASASLASTALAQKNACTACHAVDRKMVGPAFQEIAKKYAGQPGAVDKLADSIRKGGAGKWGPVPMPAPGCPWSGFFIGGYVKEPIACAHSC